MHTVEEDSGTVLLADALADLTLHHLALHSLFDKVAESSQKHSLFFENALTDSEHWEYL